RDRTWQKRNRDRLAKRRRELETVLGDHGCEVVGGTDLFVLARHESAPRIAQTLAEYQILVRTFPGMAEWLRFGIPSGKAIMKRLETALSAVEEATH
ncbi:MAG: threonine-phosphate decarboxylase, partial [Pseudomonadota bacterium]